MPDTTDCATEQVFVEPVTMKPLTSPILAKRFYLSSVQQAMPHSVFPTSFSPSTSARHTPVGRVQRQPSTALSLKPLTHLVQSGQLLYNMPVASPGASSLSGSSSASTVSSSSSSLLQHNLSSSSSSNSLPPSESPTPDPDSILSDQLWLSQFYLGISHLHNSLPEFFLPHITPAFPPEIYDPHVSLTLLPPVSLHLSSLRLYSLFFGAARTSLALALKDPWVRIERVTVIPPGEGDGWAGGLKETVDRESSVEAGGEKGEGGLSKVRIDRKVRVRCVVGGRLRLPLQVEGGLLGGGEGVDREWTISKSPQAHPAAVE